MPQIPTKLYVQYKICRGNERFQINIKLPLEVPIFQM